MDNIEQLQQAKDLLDKTAGIVEDYDNLCQCIAFRLSHILNGELTEAESAIARDLAKWGYLKYDKEEEYYRQVIKVK